MSDDVEKEFAVVPARDGALRVILGRAVAHASR